MLYREEDGCEWAAEEEGERCSHCGRLKVFPCPQSGIYVCFSCGATGFVPVVDDRPTYKELYGAETHYYQRKSRGVDYSRLLGQVKGEHGPYNRRYYWNERFNQWLNECPKVPQNDFVRISETVLGDDPEMEPLRQKDASELTRDDIALMCKKARLDKHAEKWIQLKYRICNFPIWGAEAQIRRELGEELQWSRSTPGAAIRWSPDVPTHNFVERLKIYVNYLRVAFDDMQRVVHRTPILQKYMRRSFLNFDFVMMRGLFMLCPICGPDHHAKTGECYVNRFSWALKTLKTRNNIVQHVVWFYFLCQEMIGKSAYDQSIAEFCDWEPCPSDTLLVEHLPQECKDLCNDVTLSPPPPVTSFPLRKRSESTCHRPSLETTPTRSSKRAHTTTEWRSPSPSSSSSP